MVKRFKGLFIISVILFSTAAGFAATKTWVGGDSSKPTDWDTAANWSPSGVPTSSDEVVINSGGNQPVIENTVIYTAPATKEISIKKLTINDNAILTIKSNKIRIKLKCSTGIINNGKIILDLIWSLKKIEFTKTEFKDASEIYIDAPFYGTPVAYNVTLKSSTEIDFKAGSTAVIQNGHASERFIIDTPALTAKGTLTIENKLEIKNTHDSSGLNINISGSLTAKKDFIVPDNTNTKIISSGTVNLEEALSLSNADWKASNGTITTKGNFLVPKFEQTGGTLKLAGQGQQLNITRAHNLQIADSNTTATPAVLQSDVIISGTLTNDGIFDAQANTKTVTFIGTGAKITRSAPNQSPLPENKFYNLKIADNAKLKIELSGINNNEHNKFVKIDIKNSFINGQDGELVPHFSNFVFSGGTASISSGNNNINFTDITIPNTGSLTLNNPITVGGTFQNDGTFNGGTNKVTFRSGNADLQIAGSSANMTFSEIEILGGAQLALKRNITISGKLYYTQKDGNWGKFAADSGTTVTLAPSGTTVTIMGSDIASDTKFHKLTLTNAGGKTLTINKKITVADLDISGSTPTDLLNIAGQGEITLGNNQTAPPLPGTPPQKGYYLNIHTNIPIAAGHTYTVKKSKTDEDSGFPLSDGNPKNWVFDDYTGSLVWKGTHSSNWNDWKNWSPYAKPNEQTEVTIPRLTSSPFNYPNLGTGADPNAKAKSVTVNDGAELDLGKYLIKDGGSAGAETSSVANNGTLKMTGTAGQKKWLEDTDNNDKITHGSNSTIQYNFGGTSAVVWAGPYNNLVMRTGGANIEVKSGSGLTTELNVTKNFTVHKDSVNSEIKTASVSVGKYMYINNAVTLTGGTGGIKVTEDTFIAAASGTSEIKFSTWLKTKSFVLLGGKVTLGNNASNNENSALYATGDIVLFGSAYKANDTAADGAADPSETQNLFTYNHSGRNGITASPLVNTSSFPKAPDGTELFAGYNPYIKAGSFANLGNKTLKAGKNFYANGMNLVPTGTGAWKLDIPDNDNATAAFAEAYFTTVKNCTVTGGGSVAAAEKCTDQSGNSGWEFGRPTIEKAYTYSDDTIYVKFNKPIENSNNEIQTAINAGKIRFNDGGQNFKFTSVLKVGTDGKPAGSLPAGDVAEFFLRTDGSPWKRWNTDATGISSGSNQSTDRGGSSPYEPVQNKDPRHQTIKPNLWIPKGTNSNDTLFPNLYISLRDKHKNRLRHYAGAAADASGGNGKIYGKVEDRCPPVLAAVYIGQEPHTVSSQPKYDAHNFIEFRYSEPVFIDGISDNPAIAVGEKYIRATDTLGNIATDSDKNITEVKGIASFSNGKLDTGKHGGTSGSVHAVYRTSAMRVTTLPVTDKRECRVRISVAGWVDGSVTVGGTSVHNWIGYINEALAPSGSAVPVYTQPSPNPLNTANVRTREPSASDPLKVWEKLDAQFKPKIYASSAVGLPEVGSWDTSPPVFAKASDKIEKWTDGTNTSKEITAYSASSQFADKIEFHFFDNTPNYASTALWWQTAGALISHPGWNTVNDRYDSYGGSRFTGSNRTMGGIRACTLPAPGEVKDVFIFDAEKPEFNAALQKFRGTDTAAYPLTLVQKAENEAIFGSLPSGFSEQDSLYLQLRISPPSAPLKFPVTEIFTVGYRGIDTALNGGRITDLAGNLMKSCADAKSIDASPPNIALTAAPVGLKQIYVLFTSQIDTRPETLAKIPGNLELIDRPAGSTIEIDSSVPARVRTDTKNGTGIIVSLTEFVTYNLLATAKLRVKKDTDNLIHIYPKIGVYPTFEGHKHVISDFAVNIIRPLFAYDERKLDDGTSGFVTAGIYGGTSQAVRLFDGSGTPGNTVLEKEDITVHLAVENVLPGDTSAPTNLELYMENNPNPASVSVNLNKATNLGSRIWLPAITGLPSGAVSGLSVLSPEENPCSSNEVIPLSPTVPNGFKYEFKLFNNPLTVPVPSKFLNYPDGSRAEFLFALKNGSNYILIDHDCDGSGSSPTPKIPLYALRLKDPNDPASIDLWSFDISAIKKQAGGVSILNNVINVETGEKCTIAVTAEKAGSLSVMAMTLDGDVVKVLYSGRVEKGEHLYRWNGTNKNGEAVARGMYFIRVLGPGIDETRKVMAIKE